MSARLDVARPAAAVPTLDALADRPDLAAGLPAGTLRHLRLRALMALNAAMVADPGADPAAGTVEPDRLLTVAEAAERLGTSKDWLYRRADRLPFTVRLGPGQVRFSSRGIEHYLARRRGQHNR